MANFTMNRTTRPTITRITSRKWPHGKRLLLAILWLLAATPALALVSGLPDFTGIVEANSAAVVNISTTHKVKLHGHSPGFNLPDNPNSDQLRDLLKKFLEQHRGTPDEGDEPQSPPDDGRNDGEFETESLGSGFIISPDGYVVTNHHVIEGADEIIVRMSDRREFTAKVIGSDPRSDIALLKVDAKDLPTLKLGSSERLKVGEWVLAIGSPFNFDHSVTAGIVSAKGRSLPAEQYVPFIQTDVAINPGNSGGPLFNLAGEVVGINSQIYSRTGGFMGVSFAIPIEVAMEVVEQLKTKGKVTRGWLGVYIQEINHDLAESFGMKRPRGALVAQVLPDSPAEKAGIQVGDILLSFNGKPLSHSSDLPPLVGRVPVGQQASLQLLRNGEEKTIEVTIEALPDEDKIAHPHKGKARKQEKLGLILAPLTDEQRKEEKLNGGVVIKKVLRGSPAQKAGLRKGDILLALNNEKIKDLAHFNEIVAKLPKGRSIAVLVQRDGSPVFLPLKIESDAPES